MFVIGNLFIAIARILDIILFWLSLLIFIRAVLSWVNPDPYNGIVQFFYRTTEPILQPIRRKLPRGRADWSPLIALFLIIFLQYFLVASLRDFGYRLKRQEQYNISVPAGFEQPEQMPVQEDVLFE